MKFAKIIPKMLPKTAREIRNGGIYRQYVKCGKTNCRCATGEKHPAYYYFTRKNGKLRKTYVRRSDLEHFKQLVEQAKFERRQNREVDKIYLDLVRNARSELKTLQQQSHDYIHDLISDEQEEFD